MFYSMCGGHENVPHRTSNTGSKIDQGSQLPHSEIHHCALQTEGLCTPQIHILKPNPQYDGIWSGTFGR